MRKPIIELFLVVGVVALGLCLYPFPDQAKPLPSRSLPAASPVAQTWEFYRGRGRELYQKGYDLEKAGQKARAYELYSQAVPYYQEALQLADTDSRRLESLQDLRWVFVSQQDWVSEEPYARQLLDSYEQPVKVAQAHYDLARNLYHQGRFEESAPHFQRAVELRDGSEVGPDWVYYNNYAVMLKAWGKPGEASSAASKALSIRGGHSQAVLE